MGLRDLFGKPDRTLPRIENKVDELAQAVYNLCQDFHRHHNVMAGAVERNSSKIMATIQEFRDALNEPLPEPGPGPEPEPPAGGRRR